MLVGILLAVYGAAIFAQALVLAIENAESRIESLCVSVVAFLIMMLGYWLTRLA